MASPAGARNSLFRATALGSRARGSGREIIIACRRTSMLPARMAASAACRALRTQLSVHPIARLGARLTALNPHAPQVAAIAGDVGAHDVLVDAVATQPLRDAEISSAHLHDDDAHDDEHDHLGRQGIAATTIRLDTPLDWPRYAAWVRWAQRTLGDGLVRMKGAVRMADGEIRALHAVMRLFSAPSPLSSLPDEFGAGVIILVTQDVAPSTLDEARRRLLGDVQ